MAFDVPRQPQVSIEPVTSIASSATVGQAYGTLIYAGSTVNVSTAAAVRNWQLAAPVAGRRVSVLFKNASTDAPQQLRSTGAKFRSTGGVKTGIIFNQVNEACTLVGMNSTEWVVVGSVSVSFSTA